MCQKLILANSAEILETGQFLFKIIKKKQSLYYLFNIAKLYHLFFRDDNFSEKSSDFIEKWEQSSLA